MIIAASVYKKNLASVINIKLNNKIIGISKKVKNEISKGKRIEYIKRYRRRKVDGLVGEVQ